MEWFTRTKKGHKKMKKLILMLLILLVWPFNLKGEVDSHKHPTPSVSPPECKSILELIDLTLPQMESVAQAYQKKNYVQACENLLEYYKKNKQPIKYSVDRKNKQLSTPGKIDQKWAQDALKHVFVGQKNYDSYFRGWDIDWRTNPVSDFEWIVQFHRMYWWDSMGKMYWSTKDEQYAQEWIYQFCDWNAKNPCTPENNVCWRPLETGIRLVRLVNTFEYFIESPNFNVAVLTKFQQSIHDHNQFLFDRYSEIGNHVLMEAEGCLTSGIYFSEFKDADKWREKAIKRINSEIKKQVFPDGIQYELSTSYHRGCIDIFLNIYLVAVQNGYGVEFPETYPQTIQKMIEADYKTMLPDYTKPQFGDAWKGTAQKFCGPYKKWSEVFSRDDFKYFATQGKQGKAPTQKNFSLTDSGFYALRSGWSPQNTCMILKCGPKAWFHAQPDNGSFELYALGRHFMPDSGCYIYSGDQKWRDWFRQTSVHQTLTLNEENSQCKPELLMWDSSNNIDTLILKNQSYDNLFHRRAVFFIRNKFFVLVDRAGGEGTGKVSIHFQFKEGPAEIDTRKLLARTDFEDGRNLMVQTKAQSGLQMQNEEGWVSYEYTKKIERPAFEYSVEKKPEQQHVDFVTALYPYTGNPPQITFGDFQTTDENIRFEITIDRKIYKVDCGVKGKASISFAHRPN